MSKAYPQTCWPEWRVIDHIGSGSYGDVYKIKREEEGHVYYDALKIIHIPKDNKEILTLQSTGIKDIETYYSEYADSILWEIDIMAQLSSAPHVITYKDHKKIKHNDHIGYDIYIRMELLTSLMDYQIGHVINMTEILQMGMDICRALEICEKCNIVHRDIKPDNIFVSEFGDYVLGDFGISRIMDNATVGTVAGTYHYMAPEVYMHKVYDSTIDIYSLGMVLYQYLNNGLPFMSDRPGEALRKRMSGYAIPPILSIPRSVSNIILRACSYEPRNRYQNATDICLELEQAIVSWQDPVLAEQGCIGCSDSDRGFIEFIEKEDRDEYLWKGILVDTGQSIQLSENEKKGKTVADNVTITFRWKTGKVISRKDYKIGDTIQLPVIPEAYGPVRWQPAIKQGDRAWETVTYVGISLWWNE